MLTLRELSRVSLHQLAAVLGSGAMVGLGFGGADVVRASSATGGWLGAATTAALLGLWLWFGILLGFATYVVGLGASILRHRIPNRSVSQGLLSLMVGIVALGAARKVFSGSGIRTTWAGSLGPWLVPLCMVVAVWFAPRLGRYSSARSRWSFAGFAVALSVAALVLDARAVAGLLFMHFLLLAGAVGLVVRAVELIAYPAIARYGALGLSLLTLPCLLQFPSSRSARELLAQSGWAGLKLVEYVKFHVDFDHDGYSPVFGGGDCDDTNPAVFIGAVEHPGDGKDFDCDGFDDPKRSGLPFAPFQPNNVSFAREISDRAKHFPTVVILVDALRFDRVGDPRFRNLAQLAREAMRFTHVYSVSATTLSSVPAMMNGHLHNAIGRDNIAQALARAGESSAFIAPDIVTAHFRHLKQQNPILSFSSIESVSTEQADGWADADGVSSSDQLTAAAIKQLDSVRPPNLLWLHYFDVHQWSSLENVDALLSGDVARYDAALERVDASLRPLLERREELNLVLVADHGEALGARGLRFHTSFVFHDLAHIPLLIRVPGIPPSTVETPVGSPGVFNTLRALRGLQPDATADASLLGLVGATGIGQGPGFASFEAAQWSLLYGNHRLLFMPHVQLLELYQLEQDPLEKKNIAEENPQLASELLARLLELHNQK